MYQSYCKLTSRHVVEINLSKLKTCGDFVSALNNPFINNTYVPVEKRIIILEDIDCMSDIVVDREIVSKKKKKLRKLN